MGLFRGGTQQIWEKLAAREGVHTETGVDIARITRLQPATKGNGDPDANRDELGGR